MLEEWGGEGAGGADAGIRAGSPGREQKWGRGEKGTGGHGQSRVKPRLFREGQSWGRGAGSKGLLHLVLQIRQLD